MGICGVEFIVIILDPEGGGFVLVFGQADVGAVHMDILSVCGEVVATLGPVVGAGVRPVAAVVALVERGGIVFHLPVEEVSEIGADVIGVQPPGLVHLCLHGAVAIGDDKGRVIQAQGVRGLGVGNLDGNHRSILHGNRQRLFAYKRLHTDQSPVPGFYRLCIDFCDLIICQIRTVFYFESIGFLQPANCGRAINLSNPHQLRTGEFHALHIRHELLCRFADFHIA